MTRRKIEDLRPEHLQLARRIEAAGTLRRSSLDEQEKVLLIGLYSTGFTITYLGRIKLTDSGRDMLEAIDEGDCDTVS